MKSHQVLKWNNFHLATREEFPFVLFILISRPVSDKFNNVREKILLFQKLCPFINPG